MDLELVALLEMLYQKQIGIFEEHIFPINRGVRQGDVLSPVLFNAVLEHAMAEWKKQLALEGFAISEDSSKPRLTNIRYADDILLFAQSLDESIYLFESLAKVFRKYVLAQRSYSIF